MPSFRAEIETIKLLLAGSGWAADPLVQVVLQEYDRFLGAGRLRHMERQTSLQIFFASRAIDSLLVQVVIWERNRIGLPAIGNGQRTIGSTIRFIVTNGVNGSTFSVSTLDRLINNVDCLKNQRNHFLHRAGQFPTIPQLQTFLADTTAGIQEISAWR